MIKREDYQDAEGNPRTRVSLHTSNVPAPAEPQIVSRNTEVINGIELLHSDPDTPTVVWSNGVEQYYDHGALTKRQIPKDKVEDGVIFQETFAQGRRHNWYNKGSFHTPAVVAKDGEYVSAPTEEQSFHFLMGQRFPNFHEYDEARAALTQKILNHNNLNESEMTEEEIKNFTDSLNHYGDRLAPRKVISVEKRDDGGIVRTPVDGTQEFLNQEGLVHREDGPAVIYPDGRKEYWRDGEVLVGNVRGEPSYHLEHREARRQRLDDAEEFLEKAVISEVQQEIEASGVVIEEETYSGSGELNRKYADPAQAAREAVWAWQIAGDDIDEGASLMYEEWVNRNWYDNQRGIKDRQDWTDRDQNRDLRAAKKIYQDRYRAAYEATKKIMDDEKNLRRPKIYPISRPSRSIQRQKGPNGELPFGANGFENSRPMPTGAGGSPQPDFLRDMPKPRKKRASGPNGGAGGSPEPVIQLKEDAVGRKDA